MNTYIVVRGDNLTLAADAAIDAILLVRFDSPVSDTLGAGDFPSNSFQPTVGGANMSLLLDLVLRNPFIEPLLVEEVLDDSANEKK